jgi:serine/threonine-protein kinase
MTQLSRYTLLERIGSSVLGALYKAQDNTSGSLVALKVLQLGLLDDVSSSEMDARLQRDFEQATRLQHPGIARVFEIRRDGRTALIASELVEGPSITSLARIAGGSDLAQVIAAIVQLLEAVDFAHNQLVIHRDLKPSNVLLKDGRIKITDFGMADLAARNRQDTGTLVGETEYMAPEQFLSGTIDKRCDIHAVGIILYELLTGTSPFHGDSASSMFKVLDFVPPPPSAARNGLTPAFDRLVGRALAKSPADRFLTARQFRNELLAAYVAVTGRSPPDSVSPVSVEPRAVPRPATQTTMVQSRAALTPSTDAPPAAAVAPRGNQPEIPSPRPAAESLDSRSALARGSAAAPAAESEMHLAPGSTTPGTRRAASGAVSTPTETREPAKRPVAEAVQAQKPPASNGSGAPRFVPAESRARSPALTDELPDPRAQRASAEPPRAEVGDRKPDGAAPMSGGTVLARPKPAIAGREEADPLKLIMPVAPAIPSEPPEPPARVRQPVEGKTPSGTVLATPVSRPPAEPTSLPQGIVRHSLYMHEPMPPPAPIERSESAIVPAASPPAPPAGSRLSPMDESPAAVPMSEGVRAGSPAPANNPPAPATRAAPLPSFKRVIPLTDASIAHGGRVLAQFIGPIAIVFSRRAAHDVDDERAYFELLAAHLSDPDERAQFFRKVKQRSI